MLNILIGGYYGAGNIGDEAILECMLAEMRTLEKDCHFTVLSWDPEQTGSRHGVEAIHWKDLEKTSTTVEHSDLVILGGGGLLQDYWGIDPNTYLRESAWDITAYGSLPLLAKLNNIPSMIYAVGLGPLKSEIAHRHTRIAFENSDLVTLRDDESRKLLEECGYGTTSGAVPPPRIFPDPVFSLTTSQTDSEIAQNYLQMLKLNSSSNILGLNLRYWDFSGAPETWLENIRQGVKKFLLSHDDFELLLIPFQTDGGNRYTNDLSTLEKFAGLLDLDSRTHLLTQPLTPGVTQALIGKCRLIAGMRLHSLIMAMNTRTPFIGLPYDPKITSLLNEAGLNELCCSSLNCDPNEFTARLTRALETTSQISRLMDTYCIDACEGAKQPARLALELARTHKHTERNFFQELTLDQAKIIRELDKEIKNKNTELNRANEWLTSRVHEVNSLQEERAKKDHRIETLSNNLAVKEEKEKKLLDKIEQIEKKKVLLQEQIDQHELQIRALEIQTTQAQQLASELRCEIQSKEKRIEKLEDTNIHQTETIKGLELENEKSRQTSAEQKNEIDELNHTITDRSHELEESMRQLSSIYSSRSWKAISAYYRATEHPPLKTVHDALFNHSRKEAIIAKTEPPPRQAIQDVVQVLNARPLQGVMILTSAFEFDPILNQRVIQLAKYLGRQQWGVIFIGWRWSKNDPVENIGEEVFQNIFQIPVDFFTTETAFFSGLRYEKKYLVIEFPHPDFYTAALHLKDSGFSILYDIIDEWEEFSKVGQAIWFKKEYEEGLVINADILTAVSQPLIDKFAPLRSDISLLPNGFDPNQLGIRNAGIAGRNHRSNRVHAGYFGQLTDAWLDWQFLFDLLDEAPKRKIDLNIYLIGQGEPDLKEIAEYSSHLFLHGFVKPNELWKYVRGWDLAMIPFKQGNLARAVDPIKIYEYQFFGLNTLVTGIEHLRNLDSVRVVSNGDEFFSAMEDLSARSHGQDRRWKKNGLSPEALQNTWERRFSTLLSIMETKPWIF